MRSRAALALLLCSFSNGTTDADEFECNVNTSLLQIGLEASHLIASEQVAEHRASRSQSNLAYHFTERFETTESTTTEDEEKCPPPCATIFAKDLLGPVPLKLRGRTLRIVGPKDAHAGFFVRPLWVMHQLEWAAAHHDVTKAEIFIDDTSNPYFSPGHGENWWEAYFEPLHGAPVSKADFVEERTMEISREPYPISAGWRLHELLGVKAYNYRSSEKLPLHKYGTWRRRASELVRNYVRPKPHIWKIVNDFWNTSGLGMASDVLGLHIRGTDKDPSIGGEIFPPAAYFRMADQFLAARGSAASIFLATDDKWFAEVMKTRYGDRLVLREQARAYSNIAFQNYTGDAYGKGEAVLVDSLLLSKSSFLIKSSSAVGEFAIYFNPALHNQSYDFQISTPEPHFQQAPAELVASPMKLMPNELQGALNVSAAVVLSAKTLEEVGWVVPVLWELQHARVVAEVDSMNASMSNDLLRAHPRSDVRLHSLKSRGREAAKYLSYIIREYDSLPERIVFLHGHAHGWHDMGADKLQSLRDLLSWRGEGIWFADAPHCLEVFGSSESSSGDTDIVKALFELDFVENELGPLPSFGWTAPCCAQFVTTRQSVLQHPRHFYESLYDYVTAAKDDWTAGLALEHAWVAIFTPCDGNILVRCSAFIQGNWGGAAIQCPPNLRGDEATRRFQSQFFLDEYGDWQARNGPQRNYSQPCTSATNAGCPPVTVLENDVLSLVAQKNSPQVQPTIDVGAIDLTKCTGCSIERTAMVEKLSYGEAFGEFCADLSATLRYEPSRLQANECWNKSRADLSERISRVQTPSASAKTSRNLIVLPEDGFGVIVRYAALRLRDHVLAGVQMDFADVSEVVSSNGSDAQDVITNHSHGIYYDKSFCDGVSGSHWMNCYFKPISGSSVAGDGHITDDRNSTGVLSSCSGGFACPAPWEPGIGRFGLGRFTEAALFLSQIWQLNEKTSRVVERFHGLAGLRNAPRPLVSMHIRHGDACSDTLHVRECLPVHDFVSAAERLRVKYGAKSLFVASDDADAVQQVRQLAGANWTRIVSLDLEREKYDVVSMFDWKWGSTLALDAIAEIDALASGDAFVGQFSSNVARIAFMLMVAKKGYYPPFHSLDIPLCDHFGRDDPVPWTGNLMAETPFFC